MSRRRSFGIVGAVALLAGVMSLTVPATAAPPTCFGVPATQVGTTGNDTINGTNGPDVIHGRGGNDKIFGLNGNDKLCGGDGDDVIQPGRGNDSVNGGADTDTWSYPDAPGSISTQLQNSGASTIGYNFGPGGSGHEQDSVRQTENLVGGPFHDNLTGNDLPNVIKGGGQGDAIEGDGGNDDLYGQNGDEGANAGNSHIEGGDGNDDLFGGNGIDLLRGEDGNDDLDGGGQPSGEADFGDGGPGSDTCVNIESEQSC